MTPLALTEAMDEVSARRLRLLEETDAGSGGLPDLGAEASPEARKRQREDASVLLKLGLVKGTETQGAPSIAGLSLDGEALLAQARTLRRDTVARRQYARLAFATWLLGQPAGLNHVDDFQGTPGATFYGQHLTPDEIQAAAAWLRKRDYLDGKAEWGGMILLARLTPSGEDWAENGGHDPQPHPNVMIHDMTLSGSTVAINSPGATQNAGVPPGVVTQLLEATAAIRHVQGGLGLDAEQAASLEERLAALEAEAQSPTPDKGLLRKAGKSLASFLKETGANTAGNVVGGVILRLVLGL